MTSLAELFDPVGPDDNVAQGSPRQSQGFWRRSLRSFSRNRLGVACLAAACLLAAVAAFAPALAPSDPYAQVLSERLLPPSSSHPLGTDELGRDLLSRLIYGCRSSLLVGLVSQAVALALGSLLGAVSGYVGGLVDGVVSFCIQVFSGFPFMLFSLVAMYALGPGISNMCLTLGLIMWTGPARLVRAEVLRLRSSEYVLACRASGGGAWRVISRHLLPNCASTLIVAATLGIPNAILCEASLSFLGMGVQPPQASWGQMASASRAYLTTAPWYALVPGAAIILTVLVFNLLGDALRDALDPRLGR